MSGPASPFMRLILTATKSVRHCLSITRSQVVVSVSTLSTMHGKRHQSSRKPFILPFDPIRIRPTRDTVFPLPVFRG